MRSFNEGIDWTNLAYLQSGHVVQTEVFALLTKHRIMEKLAIYDPVLVGTVPIGIQTASSDLDIICCVADFDRFEADARTLFHREAGFVCKRSEAAGDRSERITVNFMVENWPIELFGERLPVRQQNGFRHMVIESRLLALFGEAFRVRVVRLKNEGMKTEPAFARVLRIAGDPYGGLLALETWSDEKLEALLTKES
ncbi:DUF4269 domain-containing protein [Paenibacillus rhizovicinus]|uniref:DUF4269 domain-containing protein n=1 Tax=Paenibacillus rhizovicinus TaxID=2704463 RepID=A0A6C0P6Z7_9BACL|nr:DUF4269 domain-containing protein [Paenibacillus rhizovicinus]QHW34307.1 DUF4269 domain-containing protein [Paenibacillus rhizovicinus]